jgi:hypothetical protein
MGNISTLPDRVGHRRFSYLSIQPNEAIMDLTKITPISTEPFEFGPIQIKWLEALENGEYLQGAGALKSQAPFENGKHRYCCLGVLCELQGIPWEVSKDGANGFVFLGLGHYLNYPPAVFAESAGLRSMSGALSQSIEIKGDYGLPSEFSNLAEMNDSLNPNLSFKDIAAYIRHDPHNVFTHAA